MVRSAFPYIQEFSQLELQEPQTDLQLVRKWAIETVLSEQLPAIFRFNLDDQIDRTTHSILRDLQANNILPREFPTPRENDE